MGGATLFSGGSNVTCVYIVIIVIITFCYKVSKIQEKKCKVSDCPNIWLVK